MAIQRFNLNSEGGTQPDWTNVWHSFMYNATDGYGWLTAPSRASRSGSGSFYDGVLNGLQFQQGGDYQFRVDGLGTTEELAVVFINGDSDFTRNSNYIGYHDGPEPVNWLEGPFNTPSGLHYCKGFTIPPLVNDYATFRTGGGNLYWVWNGFAVGRLSEVPLIDFVYDPATLKLTLSNLTPGLPVFCGDPAVEFENPVKDPRIAGIHAVTPGSGELILNIPVTLQNDFTVVTPGLEHFREFVLGEDIILPETELVLKLDFGTGPTAAGYEPITKASTGDIEFGDPGDIENWNTSGSTGDSLGDLNRDGCYSNSNSINTGVTFHVRNRLLPNTNYFLNIYKTRGTNVCYECNIKVDGVSVGVMPQKEAMDVEPWASSTFKTDGSGDIFIESLLTASRPVSDYIVGLDVWRIDEGGEGTPSNIFRPKIFYPGIIK